MRNISALCVSRNSVYKQLLGEENCYDQKRNARNFQGKEPVIAHPPCRGWTRFGRAMKAKPVPGEKDLAMFCLEKVIVNGGVFEHPHESIFIKLVEKATGIKKVIIDQSWFGFWCRKRTVLLMPEFFQVPEIPFQLVQQTSRQVAYRDWANRDRSKTNLEFAKWLIKLVRINNE